MASDPRAAMRFETETVLRPEALLQAPLRLLSPGPLEYWGFEPSLWESPQRLTTLVLASRLFLDQKERLAFFQALLAQKSLQRVPVTLRRADGTPELVHASGRVVAEGTRWSMRVELEPENVALGPSPSEEAASATPGSPQRSTPPRPAQAPSEAEDAGAEIGRLVEPLGVPDVGRSADRLQRFLHWARARSSPLVIASPEGCGVEALVDVLHAARPHAGPLTRVDAALDSSSGIRKALDALRKSAGSTPAPALFIQDLDRAEEPLAREIVARIGELAATERPPIVYVSVRPGELADQLSGAGADRFDLVPFKERPQDILPALSRMLRRPRAGLRLFQSIHPNAAHLLQGYAWPGNVDEMRELVEAARLISGGPELRAEDLPVSFVARVHAGAPKRVTPLLPASAHGRRGRPRKDLSLEQIRDALERTRGNRAEAARRLSVSRTTLWRKIAEFGETLFPPETPSEPPKGS